MLHIYTYLYILNLCVHVYIYISCKYIHIYIHICSIRHAIVISYVDICNFRIYLSEYSVRLLQGIYKLQLWEANPIGSFGRLLFGLTLVASEYRPTDAINMCGLLAAIFSPEFFQHNDLTA